VEQLDFRPFSYPVIAGGERRSLVTRLFAENVLDRTRAFVRKFKATVDGSSSGLTDTLSAWAFTDPPLQQSKGFPLALKIFHQPHLEPVWVAAMTALHLHAGGYAGSWRATFRGPSLLRCGSVVTPPLRALSVSIADGAVTLGLTQADGREHSVTVAPGMGVTPDGCTPLPLARLASCQEYLALLDNGTRPVFPMLKSYEYAPEPPDRVGRTIGDAASILESAAPEYLGWIGDSTHSVIPIARPSPRGYQSLSDLGLHGVVFMSFPAEPLKIAELLVHECSHQYFHCLEIETLPTNGRDTSMYPSPYVGKDRPLDRILLSYHAFANIVLFYRGYLDTGASDDRQMAENAIAFHMPILDRFAEVLERTPGLTDAGRQLFEPLRQRVLE